MDLCAEMLLRHLPDASGPVEGSRVCPPFRRRFQRLPIVWRRRWALNADRLLNRFWDFPRYARRAASRFDAFHVCDHSYAQLVHELPGPRAGVYCHDLDTFRCLLEPRREPRPRWFRALAQRTLRGLQKAAIVFHNSMETRRQVERHGLIDPARLVFTPLGVSAEFSPGPADDPPLLGGAPFILHVGSCIPRKRLDVLLDVFARARARFRDLRLVQVGGEWTATRREQMARLGLDGGAVHQFRGLSRQQLGGFYRRAAVVLQTSEAEGFGLPVLEALACGAVVLASDLEVLREVGGEAAVYCPVADVAAWEEALCGLLNDPARAPSRELRLTQARRFSWAAHARAIAAAYQRLL
jgi:glycosyltransferase involved in cell wall biosynthesis